MTNVQITLDGLLIGPVHVQRLHCTEHKPDAPWLINFYCRHVSQFYNGIGSLVQARAVVDDFGTLIAVEKFS